MSRRGSEFAGLSVAIVTPFTNGNLDLAKLKEQIEFQVDAGTTCLVPVGTTGESPTLSHPEHERLISETIQIAAGRINYNKPTQEGFYQHYKAIAEAIEIPICLYNIPGRTGKNIEPETIARIAEFSNVTMVKEATGSLDQASKVLSMTDLTVLSGDDSLTLPLMSIGGEGVVSVVGNIVPKDMIALVNAYASGDVAKAQEWHHKLFPLCDDLLSIASNPIPVKAAMAELGRDSGELRLPMTPLNADQLTALRQTLANYGLGTPATV